MKKKLRTSLLGLLFLTPLLSFACGDSSVASAVFCIVPETQTPLVIFGSGTNTSTTVVYNIRNNTTKVLRRITARTQTGVTIVSRSGCGALNPAPIRSREEIAHARSKKEISHANFASDVCRITFLIDGTVTDGPTICADDGLGLCTVTPRYLGFHVSGVPTPTPPLITGTDLTFTGTSLNLYELFNFVYGESNTVTVRITNNNATNIAYNVLFDVFIPGWSFGVTSSVCPEIAANGGTCDIRLTANGKRPYAPARLTFVADNLDTTTVTNSFSFGFTLNGYIVYFVDAVTKLVEVMSDFDENFIVLGTHNSTPWYPTSTTSIAYFDDITEQTLRGRFTGHSNSREIYDYYRFLGADISYAAGLCHGKLVQNGCPSNCTVTAGTWFVPSVCQLGFAEPGSFNCSTYFPEQNIANAFEVLGDATNLQFDVAPGNYDFYWSSTQQFSTGTTLLTNRSWALGLNRSVLNVPSTVWRERLGANDNTNVRCVSVKSYVHPDQEVEVLD